MTDKGGKDNLSPEDRRGLMFASHLCHLIARAIDPRAGSTLDDDALGMLLKFAETAHAEIEQVLRPGKA